MGLPISEQHLGLHKCCPVEVFFGAEDDPELYAGLNLKESDCAVRVMMRIADIASLME